MSALGRKVMDLAEQQGLLDGKAIAELRKQVAESKFVITPEAIAKVLVDHGHLTPFQARKLVSQALGDEPDAIEQRPVEKPPPKPAPRPVEDLTFADSTPELKVSKPAEPAPKPTTRPAVNESTLRETQAKRSPGGKPLPDKLAAAPAQIIVNQGDKPVPPLKPPVEGSTADDLGELKSVEPAPHTRGNRWKTDSGGSLNETVELTPIDLDSPPLTPLPAGDLVPIDDLFASETAPKSATASGAGGSSAPLSKPSLSSAELLKPLTPLKPLQPLTPLAPLIQPRRNVWDSPLILVGGGTLGVIVVLFAFMFYALTRGSAAELFSKGEEEYRAGNYGNAIAIYEKFLKQYPEDPSASLARVRRGMANLRQVTDAGKNPRVGLETAKQILPTIEAEEKFAEARSELATILPDIAEGFATQASQTEDAARKNELVKLAGDSMALVNNPAYLPASLRKDREGHISRIVDKLKSAERGIQQEKDLVATVERISKLAAKGEAATAYELQNKLLRTYPGLATNSQLVGAIREVGEKERELVKATTGGPAPFKTDHPEVSERVILSFQEPGAPATAATVEPVFLLLEGGVYGIDAKSGKILWRRFVGYESMNLPISVGDGGNADAVFIDSQRNELVRVKGSTGGLVWRQKLSGEALGPVAAGNRILVTTYRGLIMSVDAATGEIAAAAQLPQGAVVGPTVRQTKIYQLGEHSTLFVLDGGTMTCSETVYLGHRAGELFVPPVAVLDQVLVVTSPADDYSEIQVLSPDGKTKRLAPFGRAQRLKGRIIAPAVVSAARVAVTTDLGQVAVYDIDAGGAQDHIRLVAGLDASEPTPRHGYCELDRNRLWTAGHRKAMFDVQAALSQLSRKWTENHDDMFVAPPKLQGELLVTARRRGGVAAVLVEGCRALSGESVWTTHLAAPISALVATDGSSAVTALSAECRLYTLSSDFFRAGQLAVAAYTPDTKNATVLDSPFVSADGQKLVWTEAQGGGRVYSYDVARGGKPASVTPGAKLAAPAVAALDGIVAPLSNGGVALLKSSGESSITPFLPPLVPDAMPQWTRPAPMADGTGFVISDGRGSVYAVTKQEQPKPRLALAGESKSLNPVVSPFVLAGSTMIGVVRQESTDAIAGYDSRAKPVFEPVPLEGRVEAGPFAVGGIALVAAEPDGLVCLGADGRVRWQQPAENGFLAGPPVALAEGDLLVAYQSGVVCRLDATNGKELSRQTINEPLGGPVCVWKSQAYLAGSDGVVHRISLPKRP